MRVLVIPEDSRKDKDLLRPILTSLLSHAGYGRAKVRICEDPVLGGVEEALKPERIAEIIDRYPMVDLFLVIVDRDGQPTRRARLDALERSLGAALSLDRFLMAEHAWQEVEVWVLAGHELPADWRWKEIRAEIHPKERYFRPFCKAQGLSDDAAGRSILATRAAAHFGRIHDLCGEDIAALAERIRGLRSRP